MCLAAVLAVDDEPGALEHAEMFGDGRLGNPGVFRQRFDRLVPLSTQALEDRPACRVRQRSKQDVVGLGQGQFIALQL